MAGTRHNISCSNSKQANSENLYPPPYLFSYTNISDNNLYPNHMHLLCVIVSNINLRIIFKPHANLQIMVRASVQFEKNRNKTVGGVVHTRYPMSIHFHCINA